VSVNNDSLKQLIFSVKCTDCSWGPTQPPVQLVLETFSFRVKGLKHEPDHLQPLSFDVKNKRIYTCSSVCLNGVWRATLP